MRPQSLAVLGLGAIGGSLAWQARLAGIPSVIGYAPDRGDAVEALKAGAVHDIAPSAERAVQQADLVVLAAPPQAVLESLRWIGPHLRPGALVTDVASIKLPVVECATSAGLGTRFAGSHPYTGTHVAGWEGARPDRFAGAVVYVTPTGPAGEEAAREVMDFWESVLQAHPILMDPRAHDTQLAWTSHLPQAVASALAHALGAEPGLAGASFGTGARDTTRLAASPAPMWADILLLNAGPVCDALSRTGAELDRLRELIATRDRAGLLGFLEQAARFRHGLEQEPARIASGQRRGRAAD